MKRGNSGSVPDSSQARKKTKVDNIPSKNVDQGTSQNQDGWTKVEKRKKKKEVKLESRRDVRVSLFFVTQCFPKDHTIQGSSLFIMSLTPTFTSSSPYTQTTNPRFMYSNHEIVKRSHAISIDASVSSSSLKLILTRP
jgi:hypothetical protein